jgi:hypothetical protein
VKLYKWSIHKELKNQWLSLLNKAIILDITSAPIWDKLYIKSLLLDDEYLKQAKPYQLWTIYNLLDLTEKEPFLDSLLQIAKTYKYNQFHYSVLQFLENSKLDKTKLLDIIENLNNSY